MRRLERRENRGRIVSVLESQAIYAHSKDDCEPDEWQLLDDHLCNVASRAAEFASSFGYENWGCALGLLHDAGKVSPAFQRRLHGSGERVDHSAPGAWEALRRYRSRLEDANGRLLAFAIAGHHGGMPNGIRAGSEGRTPLVSRLSKEGVEKTAREFVDYAARVGLRLPEGSALEPLPLENLAIAGETNDIALARGIFSSSTCARMLFSCVVDADHLDTEWFMNPEAAAIRDGVARDDIAELSRRLDKHMEAVQASAVPSKVNEMRSKVLEACRSAAGWVPGIYTLTVPTGGGKTLASLSFALRHAMANGMSRVIYAIPYTSIVEQNARVFRSVLGDSNVLEHHSNYDFDAVTDEERKLSDRLAIQNWDAPLVVTTNVQLFESLFSNKPGKCRKLHNIANSVIVLDEAQMLPDNLLTVTLAMLEELVADFGVTVLLCTATQPALEGHWPFGAHPREIVPFQEELSAVLGGRTKFAVEGKVRERDLVDALFSSHQSLCIVGTKKKARAIFEDVAARAGVDDFEGAVAAGAFHLSANMTPLHRSEVLTEVRRRLTEGERCIVVSTQLIEAGVDVDFPVVYREMAGIDSLIQAAGRCNREGRLREGTVHVFEISDEVPLGLASERFDTSWLGQMKSLARQIIGDHGHILNPSMSKEFFQARYRMATKQGLDAKGLYADMTSTALLASVPVFGTLDFESYAERYRLIEDASVPVFVPWGERGGELLSALRHECSRGVPAAAFAAKLQQSSISVARWRFAELEKLGAVDSKTYAPINVLSLQHDCRETYSDVVGLLDSEEGKPMDLIF